MRFICGAGFGLIGRFRFDVIVYPRHPRNLRFQLRVSGLSQLPVSRCRFGIGCCLVSDDPLRAMDESLYAGDGMGIAITRQIHSVTRR